MENLRSLLALCALSFLLSACETTPDPPDPQQQLVERGRDIFFDETFDGNGRTCGTCHREDNNFAIDPAFIATLPDDDPLFVAETNPDLMKNFENPRLMREFGLILENLDGFGDLDNTFVQRGVPHTLGLTTSIDSPAGPRTGWSGDGAPGDGTFNTPPLVEAADTGPFFHDNSIETIEGAVAFYDSDAFDNSPAGRLLASFDPNGVSIRLEATQVVEVAAFLRVINTLENIRESIALLGTGAARGFGDREETKRAIKRAVAEIDDGIRVLTGGGLSPDAVAPLEEAKRLSEKAARSWFSRKSLARQAIEELGKARGALVELS